VPPDASAAALAALQSSAEFKSTFPDEPAPFVFIVQEVQSLVQEVVKPIVAIATTNNNFFIRKFLFRELFKKICRSYPNNNPTKKKVFYDTVNNLI
jgi:hypothetical protein